MTATPNGQYRPDRSDAALARRALAVARDQAHECIEILRVLLTAASNGAAAVQAEVAWHMRDYGLDPVELEAELVHTLAARRTGRGGGRSLLLWAHPDGPPFDGADAWSLPPFAGEVRDGRIYGWTIADDLSGVAALLLTPRILRIMNADLAGDVLLVSAPRQGARSGVSAALAAGFEADARLKLRPPASGGGLSEIAALAPADVETAPESAFYATLAGAMHDVTNATPRFNPALLDRENGPALSSEQPPALCIGPRAGGVVHGRGVDEWLDIDEYLQLIAVVALTAARWCSSDAR